VIDRDKSRHHGGSLSGVTATFALVWLWVLGSFDDADSIAMCGGKDEQS